MSFAIPFERLRETKTLYAFFHPHPSYKFHVLLVPKRAYKSLVDVSSADTEFFTDLFTTIRSLVMEFHLDQSGYRLIANGGKYQDVPILHFHLISEIESGSPS